MTKTITIRVDDETYKKIRTAAEAERRTISNFIEYATLSFVENSNFISDEEMQDILADKALLANLHNALKNIEKGNYNIIG